MTNAYRPNATSHLACVNSTTDAPCPGWGSGPTGVRDVDGPPNDGNLSYGLIINGDVIPAQSAGTAWDSFCGSRNDGDASTALINLDLACYHLSDGSAMDVPPGFNDVLPDLTSGWHFGDSSYGHVAVSGHRVYFSMLNYNWDNDTAVCYDYAANNGAGRGGPTTPTSTSRTTAAPKGARAFPTTA